MKLYIMSGAENGIDSVNGAYCLITETGECLADCWSSNKYIAKYILYDGKTERIKKYQERFGNIECLYLGQDDMIFEKLIKLNKQQIIEVKKGK